MHKTIYGLVLTLIAITVQVLGQSQPSSGRSKQAGTAIGQGLTGSLQAMARAHVEGLRTESRLPDWSNYVCYEDFHPTDWFMLIGYQPAISDPWFHDGEKARAFGYSRGLTYQEYIDSDTGVTTINMPMSPEAYNEEMPKVMQGQNGGKISLAALQFVGAMMASENNAIALIKNVMQKAGKRGFEGDLLKDEETLALLDAPYGTNFNNYLDKHPDYLFVLLARQKYYSAGIADAPGGFKVYREGNVIFESYFGSDVFETADAEGNTASKEKSAQSGLAARIEMEETDSALRFVMTHSLRGSGIGIPIAGECDLLPNHKPSDAK